MRKRKRVVKKKKRRGDSEARRARKKFAYKLVGIILIIIFFLLFGRLIFYVLEKMVGPGEDSRLKGELSVLFPFTRDYYDLTESEVVKEDCSDESLEEAWDSIFLEPSTGTVIVSDKDVEEICNFSLMYKLLGDGRAYFMFLVYREGIGFIEGWTWSSYGNFTDGFLGNLTSIDSSGLEDFFGEYIEDFHSLDEVQGYRSISDIDEANQEYHNMFKVENGSWEYSGPSDGFYGFRGQEERAIKSSLIFDNKTLDILMYAETIYAPINLTQIEDIGKIVLNGSDTHYRVIDLNRYFWNLEEVESNLSIHFSITGINDLGILFHNYYPNELNFDTSNTVGGEGVMNITLSHPDWKDGEGVVSNNFNITINGCLDSDGGSDRYEVGTVENRTTSETDYCVSNSSVMEYYCIYVNIMGSSLSCGTGYYCLGGDCVMNTSAEHPPRFLEEVCGQISFYDNTNLTLDMNDCFADDDGDSLTFRYSEMNISEISIEDDGDEIKLVPDLDFIGVGSFYIYANDSKNETRSDRIIVEVVEKKIIDDTGQNDTNTTGNQSVPDVPEIISSTTGRSFQMLPGDSKNFAVVARNYDTIEWYLDDRLVKSNSDSYVASNLSEGGHTVKVDVKKGEETVSRIWSISVSGEEAPDRVPFIFFVVICVVFGMLILLIVLLIIKSVMEKEERGRNRPIIQKTRKVLKKYPQLYQSFSR